MSPWPLFLQTTLRLFSLVLPLTLGAFPKVHYTFSEEPIDVVIPYHPKDAETLPLCIEGIRKFGNKIRKIMVISKDPPPVRVDWIDEAIFPFTQEKIALELFRYNASEAKKFLDSPQTRIGWIFQQLLKFYAPFVIPDISSNVLILDSDVIFLKPVSFMGPSGQPYFTLGSNDTREYFEHAEKLLPGLHRVDPHHSGIVHHMLFQKPILDDLFTLIEQTHHTDPWRAICRCVNQDHLYQSCFSEYEIYFNFVLLRTYQRTLRRLFWTEVVPDLQHLERFQRGGYTFIASQQWYRVWCQEQKIKN